MPKPLLTGQWLRTLADHAGNIFASGDILSRIKRMLALVTAMIITSGIITHAEPITITLRTAGYDLVAENIPAEISKSADGVWTISDFLNSGSPLSFTLPTVPNESGNWNMTFTESTSRHFEGQDYPFFYDTEKEQQPVCKFTPDGESSSALIYFPLLKDNGQSFVQNSKTEEYRKRGYIYLDGYDEIGDNAAKVEYMIIFDFDKYITFTSGNLTYRVLTESTVEVAGYQDINYGVTFEIPTKVEHDGSVYDVVAIGDAGLRHAPFGSLTLPKSIKTIREFGLWNCSVLSSLLMEGVETLESKSLGVNFLNTFVLPESLKSIASDALIDCEINSLFFQSVTPPTLSDGDGGLTGIDQIGQIYVPVGSLKAYQDWSPEYSTKFEELPQISGGAKSVSLNQTEIFTIHGEMMEVQLQATVVADGEYTGEYIWHPKYGGMPEVNVDPSDPSKATVRLYNPMEGVVSVEVEGDNGLPLTASCKVMVLGAKIDNWHICLRPDSKANVKASVQPASLAKDYSLRYTSSDPAVATVDEDGNVSSVSRGFCKITVDVMNNGQVVTSNTANVDVVTEEDVVPDCGSPFMMKAGEKRNVYLKFPSDMTNGRVNWTSSNPEVVKASGQTIEAVSDGITTVTSQYELSDGTTLSVSLEVIVGKVATGEEFTVDNIRYRVLTAETVEVAGPAEGVSPTDVVIPTKVNYEGDVFDVVAIAQYAFDQYGQLTSISIPESVKSIGQGAFQSCSNLTSIEIPTSITEIAPWTFNNCTALTSVKLPEGLTSIGRGAFIYCYGLTSIDIPSTVTTIENQAFWNCSSISTIVFPASLTSLVNTAIGACYDLNSIYFLGNNPPAVLTYDGNEATGLERISSNAVIYVPADSYEAYTEQLPDNADQIAKVSIPANGAVKVELNPASLLIPANQWIDVNISATVTTESGNEYDGDYIWDISPKWNVNITTTEETPNDASIRLYNNTERTVTVTVYTPEGTPLTASCNIIPLDISMLNTVTMLKGEEYDLNASITPDNYSDLSEYTDLSIRFTSGNPQLVEVSEDGVITALEYGAANIRAEIVDADGNIITRKNCVVNICSGIRPQYSDITIPVQNGTWNYAILEPMDRNTNFTLCESNDPQMVYVSPDGWISANSVGETDITLTYTTTTGHTFPSFTCHVKVVDEITGIRISAPNGAKTMTVGSKLQLKAVSEPDGDPVPVIWESNNGYVVSVDYYTGKITAYNLGTCTITAYATFDRSIIATYEITVTEVDGITIDKSTVILNAGNSTQLNATVEPADAEVEIEWTSSNEDVASVDPLTGEVTAKNTGVATITATVKGTNISASCTVIVSNPTGIDDVDTDGVSVKGINGQIIVTGAPAEAAVEIYSIAGSRIALERGNCAVSVSAGIYVVRVAGTTVKVAVK